MAFVFLENLFMKPAKEIIVGGQAVIEGVMMRAPNSYAVAVRRQDGQIVFKAEALPKLDDRYPILKVPILRGGLVLIHSMLLGIKALNFSANVAFQEEDKSTATTQSEEQESGGFLARQGQLRLLSPSMYFFSSSCHFCSQMQSSSISAGATRRS